MRAVRMNIVVKVRNGGVVVEFIMNIVCNKVQLNQSKDFNDEDYQKGIKGFTQKQEMIENMAYLSSFKVVIENGFTLVQYISGFHLVL